MNKKIYDEKYDNGNLIKFEDIQNEINKEAVKLNKAIDMVNVRSSVLEKDARIKTPQTFSMKKLGENIQSSDENI